LAGVFAADPNTLVAESAKFDSFKDVFETTVRSLRPL